MEEDLGGSIIAMKAKDQRGNMEEEAQGGEPAVECHREGNHRRGDRLHQHHHPHLFYAVHSPTPRCNPYLNMVLYDTYYDPMMCCHPMMF